MHTSDPSPRTLALPQVPASRCTPNRHGAHHRPTRTAYHDAAVCTEPDPILLIQRGGQHQPAADLPQDTTITDRQRLGTGFVVTQIVTERTLLLSFSHPRTRWVVLRNIWPQFGQCTLSFRLKPSGQGRQNRLITRTGLALPRMGATAPAFEMADFLSQHQMLHGINRRIEHEQAAARCSHHRLTLSSSLRRQALTRDSSGERSVPQPPGQCARTRSGEARHTVAGGERQRHPQGLPDVLPSGHHARVRRGAHRLHQTADTSRGHRQ